MSKHKLSVLLGMLLTITIASAFVPISMRMRGLSPALVGIVDDEYSDIFYNPAFLNRIEGKRIYTNLSNLHGAGEDMFFNKSYYPEMTSYNLFGGITEVNGSKFGALFELGGYDYTISLSEYETEIEGNTTEIDTVEESSRYKYTNTCLNLLWGRKLSDFNLGVIIAPRWYSDYYKSTSTEISYEINPEMNSYYYEYTEEECSEKLFILPVLAGIVMGDASNEMAFSLSYGYKRESSELPVDYLESELYNEITSYLAYRTEEYWKQEEKSTQGGFYLALNGRNKKRFEDYSLAYLGEISYAHKPTEVSYFDTTYECTIDDTVLMTREIESELVTQSGSGAVNHFRIGFGVGLEKHFDILNTNTLFAIGLLPAFFTGKTTITMKPEQYQSYYYRNYPDTLEYTVTSSSNETWEIVENFGGFTMTIPVGLETHLTNRLSLRLGATQNMMLKFKDTYEETLIDAGETSTYHRTKPTEITSTTQEPAEDLDSYYYQFENKVCFSTSTSYHYGLGFKITDNVELNVLNFANLTDLSNWMVGVNIKF
jgi:hypothetical protein